jgi:hypothetical protein
MPILRQYRHGQQGGEEDQDHGTSQDPAMQRVRQEIHAEEPTISSSRDFRFYAARCSGVCRGRGNSPGGAPCRGAGRPGIANVHQPRRAER